jgi:NADPH:quinone reductase-like Zn-dependent oxidoreductase
MSLPSTMRAARVHRRGPAVFQIDTVPVPTPGPGQVLVEVASAGVNFSDVKRRRGDAYPFETAFPFTPGGEIAGTVAAHGPGVTAPPVGAPVFALAGDNGFGGYAQYALAYAPTVAPIPTGLSMDVASVLLVAGTTAKLLLGEAARFVEGETVLIPAASGGVGSYLVQMARRMGARTIVAMTKKPELARSHGAHVVIDPADAAWGEAVKRATDGRGVDVAFEATGGRSLETTLEVLAPFGRLVVYGAATGQAASLRPTALEHWLYAPAPNQSIVGFNLGGYFMGRPAIAGRALAELCADIASERLRPPPISTHPLADAAVVHERLERGETTGKLVIKPWQ